MKKWLIVSIVWCALLCTIFILARSNITLQRNNARNERNVELLTDSLYHSAIAGQQVTQTSVLELDKEQFKQTQKKTSQTAKELGIKPKDITTSIELVPQVRDSVIKVFVLKDSVFSYSDKWATFRASTKDSSFFYSVRDSLNILVNRKYKHKFLWLRWGLAGYNVTVKNSNPRGSVQYLRYIEIKK